MDLGTVEENLAALDTTRSFDLIYDLLLAYGFARASVARLRNGSLNQSDVPGELLWRTKVYYRFVASGDEVDLHEAIDLAASDPRIARQRPRFLIVRDEDRLLAVDTKTAETLDIEMNRLASQASFFLPWAGIEKAQLEALHYADVKAAEKMARLYDEVRALNPELETHALNVFFTRLLFCFFAEDTGIFERGQVTNAIASLTRADGEDTHALLDQIFVVLDTPTSERGALPVYLERFGYVNGSLFNRLTVVPRFSAKARAIVLECGELDWSEINPDIFGSMMQAVVHPDQRSGFGMHYTSVENIMKVLRPLFLDDLDAAYDLAADDPKKLRRLLDRLSRIKVFDPACGSGNFLVIAYKEIRGLENRILERLQQLDADPLGEGLFKESGVTLDHFYGIEVDDFAQEVARLGLWIAKRQMNTHFEDMFGPRLPMIPLTDAGQITCGNAARLEWQEVCPAAPGDEVYVCGNPPYHGAKFQTLEQKADMASYFGSEPFSANLDYISIWVVAGADYIKATGARVGFVSTNSICQGDHVGLLFPKLFARGVEISFAHTSFRWTNNARGNAGVTCIVLGLAWPTAAKKALYAHGTKRLVDHIGPYLRPTPHDTIVVRTSDPLCPVPPMVAGSMPRDGGHLLMSRAERDHILAASPAAARFIYRYMGADEYLNGQERYCIWVRDVDATEAAAIPLIAERFRAVAGERLRSRAGSTYEFAQQPHRFVQRAHRDTNAVIVPKVTSERREYVPMGFLGPDTVVSDKGFVIYGAEPWLFGLLQSRMHMVWLRAVGGRLKTDFSYANTLVYNTFPLPDLDDTNKAALANAALSVLAVREQFSERTRAELYDPDKMPEVLRDAHRRLDETVDLLYSRHGFGSDDERLALLFEMYERLVPQKQEALSA
jgi:hypothetical protein